jgi:hypothetical protein
MGGQWEQRNLGREDVFGQLRGILLERAGHLDVAESEGCEVTATGPLMTRWNKNLWFGAVRLGKSYVSYHLMPVYMYPDLLDGLSAPLRARMQGKSCFNFRRSDPVVFAELDRLTAAAVARLQREGIL